jgi:hypothetical protein
LFCVSVVALPPRVEVQEVREDQGLAVAEPLVHGAVGRPVGEHEVSLEETPVLGLMAVLDDLDPAAVDHHHDEGLQSVAVGDGGLDVADVVAVGDQQALEGLVDLLGGRVEVFVAEALVQLEVDLAVGLDDLRAVLDGHGTDVLSEQDTTSVEALLRLVVVLVERNAHQELQRARQVGLDDGLLLLERQLHEQVDGQALERREARGRLVAEGLDLLTMQHQLRTLPVCRVGHVVCRVAGRTDGVEAQRQVRVVTLAGLEHDLGGVLEALLDDGVELLGLDGAPHGRVVVQLEVRLLVVVVVTGAEEHVAAGAVEQEAPGERSRVGHVELRLDALQDGLRRNATPVGVGDTDPGAVGHRVPRRDVTHELVGVLDAEVVEEDGLQDDLDDRRVVEVFVEERHAVGLGDHPREQAPAIAQELDPNGAHLAVGLVDEVDRLVEVGDGQRAVQVLVVELDVESAHDVLGHGRVSSCLRHTIPLLSGKARVGMNGRLLGANIYSQTVHVSRQKLSDTTLKELIKAKPK